MATELATKQRDITLGTLLTEIRDIKKQLGKLLVLFPEESLRDYKKPLQIKKHYLRALKSFPPE